VANLRYRVGVRGALVVLIAGAALLNYSTFQGQGNTNMVPQSPLDPTIAAPEQVLTEAEKEAVFNTAMGSMESISTSSTSEALGGPISRRVKDPKNEWTHKGAIITRAKGVTNLRLSQTYKGLKVRNGHLTMQIVDGQSQADPASMHMEYIDDIMVDTRPKLAKQRAISIARQLAKKDVDALGGPAAGAASNGPDKRIAVKEPTAHNDDAVLEIHPGAGRGNRKLAWHVSTRQNAVNGPVLMETWVDQDGNVLESYNNLQSGIFAGMGQTLYQGDRGITIDAAGGGYVMNDNSLLIGVYDKFGGATTYQAFSSNTNFGNNFTSDRNSTNADTYSTTSQTLSFMYWVLGRDFVDGSRGPRYYNSVDGAHTLITARNHVGVNYNNAYWDPADKTINLGDGDGASFSPLVSLDIVGHEWAHGLTQYTAGLVYRNEPGAINESFSDIMGAMTERYWRGESGDAFTSDCNLAANCKTWKIGEESRTPGTAGDALRYMNEPWRKGDPWHYSLRDYPDPCTPSIFNDNCGVHTNSGISNFAFYSLSKGWPGAVTGIGASKATQIFYKALRDCMISSDGFRWTRLCTQWAASSLYGAGSVEATQTKAAWDFVGAPL
jgi:Zn-dependent metalloprotease